MAVSKLHSEQRSQQPDKGGNHLLRAKNTNENCAENAGKWEYSGVISPILSPFFCAILVCREWACCCCLDVEFDNALSKNRDLQTTVLRGVMWFVRRAAVVVPALRTPKIGRRCRVRGTCAWRVVLVPLIDDGLIETPAVWFVD